MPIYGVPALLGCLALQPNPRAALPVVRKGKQARNFPAPAVRSLRPSDVPRCDDDAEEWSKDQDRLHSIELTGVERCLGFSRANC